MRAASFVMGMGSVQTYVAKRLPSSRRIPFGNEEFEKISEVVTLGQASRPRSGSASDAMRANQEAAARSAPPSRETVQQWLETLQKGDRAARETAAKSLASSAPADCTAALVKALDDESPVVRSAMLQALERLKAARPRLRSLAAWPMMPIGRRPVVR